MRPARRWLVFLSAAIAALLAVVVPPAVASAAMQPAAGTRVGASHPATIPAVGASGPVSPGQGRCREAPQPDLAAGACVAAEDAGSDWADLSGVLRDAAKGKGYFGIGSATQEQAVAAGRAWVGDNATLASDGKTWVSQDGLRQFRPPSYKPNLDQWQANFEWRVVPCGAWLGNGHLDITDAP
jgi:hypothetical protein